MLDFLHSLQFGYYVQCLLLWCTKIQEGEELSDYSMECYALKPQKMIISCLSHWFTSNEPQKTILRSLKSLLNLKRRFQVHLTLNEAQWIHIEKLLNRFFVSSNSSTALLQQAIKVVANMHMHLFVGET